MCAFEAMIKCAGILRVIVTARTDIAPLAEVVLSHLKTTISTISKNPSNPKFNHYAFDALGALIRFTMENNVTAVESFENALLPPFIEILRNDVVGLVSAKAYS